MTSLRVTRVEFEAGEHATFPENATLTTPLSAEEIRQAISDVVARADRGYVLDLVTALQVKARIAEDTGERLTLHEFADQVGFDLEQLRSE